MRTLDCNKLRIVFCAALILLVSTPSVFAYPPDERAAGIWRMKQWKMHFVTY
jgi:hypothetical protein